MGTVLLGCGDYGFMSTLIGEIEGQGHATLAAATGQEVVELATAQKPDIIILSPALPVFDGLETARMLRADPDIPTNLAIVLIGADGVDPRTAESAGITETMASAHTAAEIADLLVRHMPPEAMPER